MLLGYRSWHTDTQKPPERQRRSRRHGTGRLRRLDATAAQRCTAATKPRRHLPLMCRWMGPRSSAVPTTRLKSPRSMWASRLGLVLTRMLQHGEEDRERSNVRGQQQAVCVEAAAG